MSYQPERELLFLQSQKKNSNTSTACPYTLQSTRNQYRSTLYLHFVISKQSEVEIKKK